MSSSTIAAPGEPGRVPHPLVPRLAVAELLKLRRRRGLVVTTLLLTVGGTVLTYGILALLHAVDPAAHGPAGGVENLGHGLVELWSLSVFAAALVGTTAGAGDIGAGVFRELVVTGRSRLALFCARIPGGLAFLLPCVAVAYVLTATASVAFADDLLAPSAGLLAEAGGWLVLAVVFYYLLSLGVASLIGSQTTTIVVLLVTLVALQPILLSIGWLGAARDALPDAALGELVPGALAGDVRTGPGDVSMPIWVAAVVLLAWTAVWLGIGAWRTRTRDA